MMDDDLFDYYGGYHGTYQDYECVDMIRKVFETKGMIEDFPNIPIGMMLMDEDKNLLEDFATIFNTLDKSLDLYESMLGLLKLVKTYRSDLAYQHNVPIVNEWAISTHKKKDTDERLRAFKNNLYSVYKMLDSGISTEKSQTLQKILQDAMNNPCDYLNHRRNAYNASTKDIEDYLRNLNLYNSSRRIDRFIDKIKTISH